MDGNLQIMRQAVYILLGCVQSVLLNLNALIVYKWPINWYFELEGIDCVQVANWYFELECIGRSG